MKAKATRTPWPVICWTKKRIQVTLVAWQEEIVGEEKAKWLARPFSAKMIPFRQRKFGKESLVWGQKLADKDAGLQPKLRVVPHPQKETLVLDRHWRKRDAKSANSEDATRP